MADAIDGAQHQIRLVQHPVEPRGGALRPAVVMAEAAVRPLDQRAEMAHRSFAPADIGNAPSAQVDDGGLRALRPSLRAGA